jgi:hypothetical protein
LVAGIAPASCWSLMNRHITAARAGTVAIARRRPKQDTSQHTMRIAQFRC